MPRFQSLWPTSVISALQQQEGSGNGRVSGRSKRLCLAQGEATPRKLSSKLCQAHAHRIGHGMRARTHMCTHKAEKICLVFPQCERAETRDRVPSWRREQLSPNTRSSPHLELGSHRLWGYKTGKSQPQTSVMYKSTAYTQSLVHPQGFLASCLVSPPKGPRQGKPR